MNIYTALAFAIFAVVGIICALGWERAENRLETAHRRERRLIAENERYREINRKLEFRTALTETVVDLYRVEPPHSVRK